MKQKSAELTYDPRSTGRHKRTA